MNNQEAAPKQTNSEVINTLRAEFLINPNASIKLTDLVRLIDMQGDLAPVFEFAKEKLDATKSEVLRAIERQRATEFLGFYPTDAEDYVTKRLQATGVDVTYQGAFNTKATNVKVDGVLVTPEGRQDRSVDLYVKMMFEGQTSSHHVIDRLFLDAEKAGLGFRKDLLNSAVSQFKEHRKRLIRLDTYNSISYSPGSVARAEPMWAALAEAMCLGGDTDPKLAAAVLKKFVYQVKRKLLELPIYDHLMPVVTGPQGVGKSTLIRDYFCSPVAPLMAGSDFTDISEAKNFELWDNFVLFFDEMGKAAKTDIETIKKRITDPMVTSRILTTHQNGVQPNRATFIGCCNEQLSQVIMDKTGVRRFFPIHTSHKMRKGWEVFAQLDWALLWQSVDERGVDPTKQYHAEIWAVQEEERTQSLPEEWARWAFDNRKSNKKPVWAILGDFYNKDGDDLSFVAYKDQYSPDSKAWSLAAFGKEMTRLCRDMGEAFPLEKNDVRSNSGFKYRWRDEVLDQVSMLSQSSKKEQ